jgi:Fe2+ transport system protein B
MHNDQILTVHESYKVQMQQMREANANHLSQMLDAHRQQVEHIQKVNDAQHKAMQDISKTQIEANERSNSDLMNALRFWRLLSVGLLVILFFIVIVFIIKFIS